MIWSPLKRRFAVADARLNPNLVLRIRADRATPFDLVFQVTDMCANNGIKVSFRSEPREKR